MAIKIDMRDTRTEFDFGGELVVADTSDEAIKQMLSLKSSELSAEAEARVKELQGVGDEEITAEEFAEMVDICLDLYGRIYDAVFIDDAFRRVYDRTKSIQSTVIAFERALVHVTEQIERHNADYTGERAQLMNKFKNRKK